MNQEDGVGATITLGEGAEENCRLRGVEVAMHSIGESEKVNG